MKNKKNFDWKKIQKWISKHQFEVLVAIISLLIMIVGTISIGIKAIFFVILLDIILLGIIFIKTGKIKFKNLKFKKLNFKKINFKKPLDKKNGSVNIIKAVEIKNNSPTGLESTFSIRNINKQSLSD